MAKRPRTLRDLCIAAREGNRAAIRALLRRSGKTHLLAEMRPGRPLPPSVGRMVAAMTAGTGTRDQLSEWEEINERGEIENLLHVEPLPPHLLRESE